MSFGRLSDLMMTGSAHARLELGDDVLIGIQDAIPGEEELVFLHAGACLAAVFAYELDGVLQGRDIRLLDAPDGLVAFVRTGEAGDVLCVFNLSDEPVVWSPGNNFGKAVIVADEGAVGSMHDIPGTLAPYTGFWAIAADRAG